MNFFQHIVRLPRFSRAVYGVVAAAQAERERWILALPLGLGVGIWLYFAWPQEPSRWCLLLTPGLLALLFVPGLRVWRLAVLSVLVLAAGFNASQLESWRQMTPMLENTRYASQITGRVVALDPAVTGVTLQLDQLEIPAWPMSQPPDTIRIKWRNEGLPWPAIGSRVTLAALLMPLSEPVAPDAFDFRLQGFFNGIGAQGVARGTLRVVEPPHDGKNSMLAIAELRAAIGERVMRVLSGDAAQIALALLNGAQSGISAPVLQDMRASGLFHILSISGLHLAIVAAFMFVGVRRILALSAYAALHWPLKKIAAVAAMLVLPLYTLLVGMPVPAVRSALMTGVVLLAVLVERRALSLRTVALAATVLLLAVPHALLGASFQLSFAAVTVMIAGYEALRRWRQPYIGGAAEQSRIVRLLLRLARFAGGLVFTSLLATLATAPFTLYQFQSANWYGLFANLLGIPLTSFVIMPSGFLAYALMPLSGEGWALQLMGWGIERLIALSGWVAGFPGATLRVAAWPLSGFFVMLMGGVWLCLWQRRWRLWGFLPLIIGLGWCLFTPRPDVYLAPGLSNWAMRLEHGQWLAQRAGEKNFAVKQWRQREGGAEFTDFDQQDHAPMRCDDAGCFYRTTRGDIALAWDAAAVAEECGRAAVIITPLWRVRCEATPVVDGAALKWRGAATIRLRSGAPPEIKYARRVWGARPWSPGWRDEPERFLINQTVTSPAAQRIPSEVKEQEGGEGE